MFTCIYVQVRTDIKILHDKTTFYTLNHCWGSELHCQALDVITHLFQPLNVSFVERLLHSIYQPQICVLREEDRGMDIVL